MASARVGTQLVAEAGLLEQPARGTRMLLADEQAPRQNSDRAFQHAHILVEHEVRDVGRIQQRLNGGNEHSIIGAYELAQSFSPILSLRFAGRTLLQIGDKLGNCSLLVEARHEDGDAMWLAFAFSPPVLVLAALERRIGRMPHDKFGSGHGLPLLPLCARTYVHPGILAASA